jgi:oligopeptide transport system permease protein
MTMDTERQNTERTGVPTPFNGGTEAGLNEILLEESSGLSAVSVSRSPLHDSLIRFARDRRALASLIVFVVLFGGAFVLLPIYEHIGPTLVREHGFAHVTPMQYHGPQYLDDTLINTGPSSLHWLGTDDQGTDLLARLLSGIQVSIIVASIVVLLFDVGLGIFFGVLAGYFGGILDTILARFTDLIFAFPGLLFAVLITGIFSDAVDKRFQLPGDIVLVSLTLGFTIWPQMARYVRGQTLQLKQQQYIEASRTIGTSSFQIITRHILPNMASLIVVAATLDFATTVVNEGVLSLLNIGIRPPNSSLGLMISQYIPILPFHPFEDLLPAFALVIIVLSFSFIGDGLRDAFDPRTKD